ncbi:ATP-binding protein [Streptomyces fimicarius]|uniref:ATP-binding protein n=2 Tax=Streptomyces TaxID=1883 RepID=A0AB33KMH6_9ACTN|nr:MULTISPECIES: ATP-binding protein [Streptomyces]WSV23416.1 ATP-binding protein [Streptomyces fimicarius]MCL6287303.1 ATP-binding protein [Streptomyces sp. 43Y-GA-1]MCX4711049.1 ATP-binding protein [Streptomyces griseus]MDX2673545.1 ATP-binding protein [Streptomyces sp. NRRL_ISP-5395]MDX3336349.1 ATP-binding protein [Streptomyces sp. ME02-6979.5a]
MNRKITQPRARTGQFAVQLSATRRGARLARLLATEQLRSWGLPLEDASLVIGELATNAALHGYVPGRDFRILLSVYGDVLRIEVADTRGDRLPEKRDADAASDGGRGLLLVEALSVRWGTEHGPFPRKTVWAEVALTGS